VTVDCVDPTESPDWCSLLGHHAAGLFHSPPWMRAVRDAYGFEVRAYIVRDRSGLPVAGVAFCELDDVAGHRLISLPFSDTCDPLFYSPDGWTALFDRLRAHGIPLHLRCLVEPRLLEPRIPADDLCVTKRARWHRLAVTASREELFGRMAPAARRAIRRAQRAGVKVRPLSADADHDAFHRLHVALRKQKYRLLAQPRQFFAALEQRFREVDGSHLLAAFLDDRMIAATLYLRWNGVLYYKFNTSDPGGLAVRPNNLLLWEGIALAQSLGCATLDLGPSDDDQPGLIRFKRDCGAAEHELRFLRWSPPGWHDSDARDVRSLLGQMTGFLTEPGVSDEVAARAGAAFYRFFA
jgi:CelD/BcsL family acetyltransferase involved in cellulose biosynthesis